MTPNRLIKPQERTQWAVLGHVALLQCIGDASKWTSRDFAFHGGTSLHLSRNSPRYSEDLDFLLSKNAANRLLAEMQRIAARLREMLLMSTPALTVSVRDKSAERMGGFDFTFAQPGILRAVKMKAEFCQWSRPILSNTKQVCARRAYRAVLAAHVSALTQCCLPPRSKPPTLTS